MDFDDYLKGYCRTYKISPEVAKTHKMVQNVKEYYEEVERERIKNNDGVYPENNINATDGNNVSVCDDNERFNGLDSAWDK